MRDLRGSNRTARNPWAWLRPGWLVLGLLLAGTARAYDVVPGSQANAIHIAIDDRAGLTRGARLEAAVIQAPSWVTVRDAGIVTGPWNEIVVHFDAGRMASGTGGSLAVRLRGFDSAGRQLFQRIRRIPLVVRNAAAAVQQSYDVEQCCEVVTAVGERGLVPGRFVLVGNSPNPFQSLSAIVFGLPEGGGPVRLAIYDAGGRKVRTVVTPALGAGYHQIAWDGRDQNGRGVSPGTYFYRIACGVHSATGKMQLVR